MEANDAQRMWEQKLAGVDQDEKTPGLNEDWEQRREDGAGTEEDN